MRSLISNKTLELRNPYSTRPYQHVLESVFAYIYIACKQYHNILLSGEYNIGPDSNGEVTTEALVKLFLEKSYKKFQIQQNEISNNFHEANFLKLDNTKAKTLGISPRLTIENAVDLTLDWIKVYEYDKSLILELMINQIKQYFE